MIYSNWMVESAQNKYIATYEKEEASLYIWGYHPSHSGKYFLHKVAW
jgi:hypothetical protein